MEVICDAHYKEEHGMQYKEPVTLQATYHFSFCQSFSASSMKGQISAWQSFSYEIICVSHVVTTETVMRC